MRTWRLCRSMFVPPRPRDAEAVAAIYNHGIAERQATFETRPRRANEILGWLEEGRPFIVAADARRRRSSGSRGCRRIRRGGRTRGWGSTRCTWRPRRAAGASGVKLLEALVARGGERRVLQAHEPGVHDQPREPEAAPGGGVHRGGHPEAPRAARRRVEGHGPGRTSTGRGRALSLRIGRTVAGDGQAGLAARARARRRPGAARWIVPALLLQAALAAIDIVSGDEVVFTTTFVLAPFALAVSGRARPTAILAALALVLAIASGYWNHYEGSTDHLLRIAIVAAGGVARHAGRGGARAGGRAAPADGDPGRGRAAVRGARRSTTRSRAWPRRSCPPRPTAAGSTWSSPTASRGGCSSTARTRPGRRRQGPKRLLDARHPRARPADHGRRHDRPPRPDDDRAAPVRRGRPGVLHDRRRPRRAGARQRAPGDRPAIHAGAPGRHPQQPRRGRDGQRRPGPHGVRQPRGHAAARPRLARRRRRTPAPASSPRASRSPTSTASRVAARRLPRPQARPRRAGAASCSRARIDKPSGRAYWLLTKASLLQDQGRDFAVNIIEDVTEAKEAEQRQRFLAQAGQLLASSLDYEQTLKRVAALAVPWLADWCAVDLPATGRDDRAGRARARRPARRSRMARGAAPPLPAATRTPRPACPRSSTAAPRSCIADIPDELLDAGDRGPEQRAGAQGDRHALGDDRPDARRGRRRSARSRS